MFGLPPASVSLTNAAAFSAEWLRLGAARHSRDAVHSAAAFWTNGEVDCVEWTIAFARTIRFLLHTLPDGFHRIRYYAGLDKAEALSIVSSRRQSAR
jgi:hypothetical protein